MTSLRFNLGPALNMWNNACSSVSEFTSTYVSPTLSKIKSFTTVAVIMQVTNMVFVRMAIDDITTRICKNNPADAMGTNKEFWKTFGQKTFSATLLCAFGLATHAAASYCVGSPISKVAAIAIAVASVVSTLGLYLLQSMISFIHLAKEGAAAEKETAAKKRKEAEEEAANANITGEIEVA